MFWSFLSHPNQRRNCKAPRGRSLQFVCYDGMEHLFQLGHIYAVDLFWDDWPMRGCCDERGVLNMIHVGLQLKA